MSSTRGGWAKKSHATSTGHHPASQGGIAPHCCCALVGWTHRLCQHHFHHLPNSASRSTSMVFDGTAQSSTAGNDGVIFKRVIRERVAQHRVVSPVERRSDSSLVLP